MNDTDHQLLAIRVADAFRVRLGLSDWEHVKDFGWHDDCGHDGGHLFLFQAKPDSEELGAYGIASLGLVVTVPVSVFADINLSGGRVSVSLFPQSAYVTVNMKPFGVVFEKFMGDSEITKMRRECEPFRLVMEAVEAASAQLEAEAKAQEEEEQ